MELGEEENGFGEVEEGKNGEKEGHNFRDEEYEEETTKIGKFVLASMRFEIINGRVTKNAPTTIKKT